MSRLFTVTKRALASFGSDRCAMMAAAVAYRTIFSLFPLALVGVSVLGFIVEEGEARDRVVSGIVDAMSLGTDAERSLESTLAGVSGARGWLGIVGLLGALWSASGLFGELRLAMDTVWDVERPRPLLRAKLLDLLLMVAFGGLLGLSTASTGLLSAARRSGVDWLGPVADMAGGLFALLVFVLPLTLTFLACLVLFRFAPNARPSVRDVAVAALLAALFFEFGKNLLAFYLTRLGSLNALAGSLGAAIFVLVFVYYAVQVLLLGAEFAKHLMLVRTGAVPALDRPKPPPRISLGTRIKHTLGRLWHDDIARPDESLPYQPERIAPPASRPTDSAEEVYFFEEQRARAMRAMLGDSEAGRTPALLDGVATLKDGRLMLANAHVIEPLWNRSIHTILRDGKPATLDDLHEGDLLTATLGPSGEIVRLHAHSVEQEPAQSRGPDLLPLAGFAGAFILRLLWGRPRAATEANTERPPRRRGPRRAKQA